MKIKRKDPAYRPVVIELDTLEEWQVFRAILNLSIEFTAPGTQTYLQAKFLLAETS